MLLKLNANSELPVETHRGKQCVGFFCLSLWSFISLDFSF